MIFHLGTKLSVRRRSAFLASDLIANCWWTWQNNIQLHWKQFFKTTNIMYGFFLIRTGCFLCGPTATINFILSYVLKRTVQSTLLESYQKNSNNYIVTVNNPWTRSSTYSILLHSTRWCVFYLLGLIVFVWRRCSLPREFSCISFYECRKKSVQPPPQAKTRPPASIAI